MKENTTSICILTTSPIQLSLCAVLVFLYSYLAHEIQHPENQNLYDNKRVNTSRLTSGSY